MDTSWFHCMGGQHHISKAVSHAAILIYLWQVSQCWQAFIVPATRQLAQLQNKEGKENSSN